MWSSDPSPAPYSPDPAAGQYDISIESTNLADARIQSLTFTMQVTDTVDDQYFEPSISFDIELLHPCRRTAFEVFTVSPITYELRSGQDQDLEIEVPKDPVSTKFGT